MPSQAISVGELTNVGVIALPQASFTVGVAGAISASAGQFTVLPSSAAGVKSTVQPMH